MGFRGSALWWGACRGSGMREVPAILKTGNQGRLLSRIGGLGDEYPWASQ